MGVLVENNLLRREVSCIWIANKEQLLYIKVSQQCKYGHLPPVIHTCYISRMFLQSIIIDISDFICWNNFINSNRLKRCYVRVNKVTNVSIFTTSFVGNSAIRLSKYPLLESLYIETSDFKMILFIWSS